MNTKRKINLYKVRLFLSLCLLTSGVQGQDFLFRQVNFGFNVGGNFAFGTHFQRLGLNFNFFYCADFVQANTELRTYFNFRNLGPKQPHGEVVLSQGLVFAYGNKGNSFNPFVNQVSNQTGYPFSIAYAYNAYFNKINTSQQTGMIALQFGSAALIVENDILARPMLDRFRTGAFLIQVQHENIFQAAINCSMWTGALGRSIRGDSCYPAVGYMDTCGGALVKYSHGLLSAQFRYHLGVGQTAQVNAGVDAEQVRHFVQNRLIHDVFFIPKKWFKRKNCHIPMLDENGDQFLYRADQKIKKPSVYMNLFSNANLFY